MRHMEGLTDEQLLERWQADKGSMASIDELFRRHHRRVALWCLRFAGDRDTAADWAQDVFMSAYLNLDSFRGGAKFSTWLYAIARNHCINQVRARAARPETEIESVLATFVDAGGGEGYQRIESEDTAAALRRLLQDSLDETEYRVLMLHYGEDVPLDAVTRLLGLRNVSGAKAYVVSARRKLEMVARKWKARVPRTGWKYAGTAAF